MKTERTTINPEDELCAPWKCRKCNIIFTDKEKMIKHLWDTSFRRASEGKGVFFHLIVDRYGRRYLGSEESL